MSKQNHTPAPWAVDINTNHAHEAETIRGADNVRIAATYKIHEHRADRMGAYYETRANARLIAAAPELLEALKVAESELRYHAATRNSEALNIVRAAINKATGGEQ
jgi:hypothetical protein